MLTTMQSKFSNIQPSLFLKKIDYNKFNYNTGTITQPLQIPEFEICDMNLTTKGSG